MAQMYVINSATPSLSERVAAEIRAWRGRLNISQAKVGQILGLSQGQVSARLLGKVPFSLREIELLAEAWGIDPSELLGYGQISALTRDDGMSRFRCAPPQTERTTSPRLRRAALKRLRRHSGSDAA